MRSLARLFLIATITLLALNATAAERTTYLVPDAQGSPVAALDEQGNVLWRETYRPYGERQTRSPANDAKTAYAGKPEDIDTGLIYMGARWYDPETARFTGIDPLGFSEGNPQSFGRYGYANNSPYRYMDPNGESPVDIVFLAYDAAVFAGAVHSGNTAAMADTGTDLAASLVGVMSPVPGTGQAIKAAKAADKAATSGKTLILGENMRDRVQPFAEATGATSMPFGTTREKWDAMTPKERYKLNDGQLRQYLSDGYEVKYIGRDKGRSESKRAGFDLTGSELLRLESRGTPYEKVSPGKVRETIGRD